MIAAPVPKGFADQPADALLFRRNIVAVRSLARQLLRECERDLKVIEFVGNAQCVEFFVPPPTPVVFKGEPSDIEAEGRTADIFIVDPHLTALEIVIVDPFEAAWQQIFLLAKVQLREQR